MIFDAYFYFSRKFFKFKLLDPFADFLDCRLVSANMRTIFTETAYRADRKEYWLTQRFIYSQSGHIMPTGLTLQIRPTPFLNQILKILYGEMR